jgi:hypothetical protein
MNYKNNKKSSSSQGLKSILFLNFFCLCKYTKNILHSKTNLLRFLRNLLTAAQNVFRLQEKLQMNTEIATDRASSENKPSACLFDRTHSNWHMSGSPHPNYH